jgi:beta-glucosidase
LSFPKEFVWGAATAAYQIEGGAYEDGKGLSIWDVFCRENGVIKDGCNGDTACDHYHRYAEDVDLMKQIGLQAYRFSIAWPRILPDGTGKLNEKGLDFYDRLVDKLIANGIIPYVTLFHWDYPYELYKKGGWLNEDSPCWFADYVRIIVERLSDRVTHWFTINEPECIIALGHQDGVHAPGIKLSLQENALAAHHLLLAHGLGVQTIRGFAKQLCKIGLSPALPIMFPDSDSVADIEAAREKMFTEENINFWSNVFWLDPIFKGAYPEALWTSMLGKHMPEIKPEDLAIISQPLDFFGMNHYAGTRIKLMNNRPTDVPPVQGAPLTKFNWAITPESLYWGPKFCFERYHKPVLVTENGLSNSDWEFCDGAVHDPQRIDFLHRYLGQYLKAAEDGVAMEGYFHWSLLDNFEWAEGYRERFGLIHVNYTTQKRIIKDSGYWYRKIIASNGDNLSKPPIYNCTGI